MDTRDDRPASGGAQDARESREHRGLTEVAGVVVLGGCALWALVCGAGREARPEGVLLAVLAVAAGYACGRIFGTLLPVLAATGLSLGALGLALASREGMPGSIAYPAPGHTGAAAALLVLAAGAACCAAGAARPPALRVLLRLVALGVAGVALALGSEAGFAAALGILLCSLAAVRMRQRLLGLAGLAVATVLVAGASWAVAEDVLPEGLTASLEGQLTQNRVELWQDALAMAKDNPLRGVGPERFGELSVTTRQSVNSDGKPHSAPLQQAAEQGIPGVVLLATAFGWLLYELLRSPRSTQVVLTAGAALTALAALASIGNALSFTPVTAGAALLAGLASARLQPGESAGPLPLRRPGSR
ncbi:O-antigen ligase family protein [Streptomyces sp. NPDC051561]|uniref:O-antigen ligase family protein n=1 Tax=Streptomyces sp. NPDC051561 TaxID=3365658 RepID=UPI0037895A9F